MIRRLEFIALGAVLVIAAFSTGIEFLFYLLYLAILVVGGSYVLTRIGLADLEAGYAVSQLNGHVGEQLRVTYTMRNTGRLPKPWLEVHNPTSLPIAIPGRAVSLGSRAERSWVAKVPLTRRGHYRIEPLQVRTGDPFGFFEASATVGQAVTLIVYPRIEALPLWRLPAANLEGTHAAPERTIQTSPLATTIRPYAPGDSMNRIHWKSTARHGEIQVKEFDLDRGSRQYLKIMQLLAAVDADGSAALVEGLVTGLSRLRRGMTAVVITPSVDRAWVRALAGLRGRGVACVVLTVDTRSAEIASANRYRAPSHDTTIELDPDVLSANRALRHTLAEYDLRTYRLEAGRPLGELLAG